MRPTFLIHDLTKALVERLARVKQGEHVTWRELSAILGMNAQEEGRHHVDSARRIMLREHGRVFEVIIGEGVKWLTDAEVAKLGTSYTRRLGRMARRWRKKATCVDYKKLNQQQITEAMQSIAQAGFFEQAAHAARHQQAPRDAPQMPGTTPGFPFKMG